MWRASPSVTHAFPTTVSFANIVPPQTDITYIFPQLSIPIVNLFSYLNNVATVSRVRSQARHPFHSSHSPQYPGFTDLPYPGWSDIYILRLFSSIFAVLKPFK